MSGTLNTNGIRTLPELINEYEKCLRELRELQENEGQVRSIKAEAPRISGWAFMQRAVPCIVGTMRGHPLKNDGTVAATTEILFFDSERKIIRTRNRWYTLGEPLSHN